MAIEFNDQMTFIIKVTDNCPLNCVYCYNKWNESDVRVMPREILKDLIIKSNSLDKNVLVFTWHGGEPFLADIDFYRSVVDFQKRYIDDSKKIISVVGNDNKNTRYQLMSDIKNHPAISATNLIYAKPMGNVIEFKVIFSLR